MISSMTGYGRAHRLINGRDITVEIKSVNHRFFEFSAKIPRAYGYLEEKLKSFVYNKVSRGKIDMSVTILTIEGTNAHVELNKELANSYLLALRGMANQLEITDDITANSLSRFSDIFAVRKNDDDEAVIWDCVCPVAAEAVEKFIEMRRTEGDKLKSDVLSRLGMIEGYVQQIESRSPTVTEEYRARLYAKLQDLLGSQQIEEQRILTEAAIFAEKTAVAEETVRLASHVAQLKSFLAQNQPVGRKLDFLVQEFNREANTIGSKCQDMAISRIVVELKSEIEKIREQIQNIE